ncbi:MAG: hypothetical protein KAJ62_15210 [Desulfobacteraceae bacterium]|nr:hypothetical protein [Desulfobacteraceae bacterium]
MRFSIIYSITLRLRIKRLAFMLLFFSILLFPVNLFAHKVYVFAWAESGKIFTESKFSSNKWVKNGNISVQDEKGKVLLTGTTSDQGVFIFEIPSNLESYLLIKLDAGMGHKAEWKLEFEEIIQANTGKSSKEIAEKKKDNEIKNPSIANVIIGILIIFVFFGFIAFYNKKLLNKK